MSEMDVTLPLPSPDKLAEMLAASPRLPDYERRLSELMAAEQEKRRQFHADLEQYEAQKVEFINGEVVRHMPVKKQHLDAGQLLLNLLQNFVAVHDLGVVGYEKAMISLRRNDYEPDVVYFNKAKAAAFDSRQILFPAPDLAVEILSPSSEQNDRRLKMEDYAANGIAEYWIVDADEESVEQYALRGEMYDLRLKARTGLITSEAVPGFEIPIRAIFDRDENLRVLQDILSSRKPAP
jgi:Uma2 family endonuclease